MNGSLSWSSVTPDDEAASEPQFFARLLNETALQTNVGFQLADDAAIAWHAGQPLPDSLRVRSADVDGSATFLAHFVNALQRPGVSAEHLDGRGVMMMLNAGEVVSFSDDEVSPLTQLTTVQFLTAEEPLESGLTIAPLREAVAQYVRRMEQSPELPVYPLVTAEGLDQDCFNTALVSNPRDFIQDFAARYQRDFGEQLPVDHPMTRALLKMSDNAKRFSLADAVTLPFRMLKREIESAVAPDGYDPLSIDSNELLEEATRRNIDPITLGHLAAAWTEAERVAENIAGYSDAELSLETTSRPMHVRPEQLSPPSLGRSISL